MRYSGFAIALSLLFLCRVGATELSTMVEAVEAGNVATVKRLLAEGVGVEARDNRGWTPLIAAANNGNLEIAKLLIVEGADVNARSTSTNGSTVLCFAAQSDDPDLLDLLLQHGAHINARSKNGATALFNAVAANKERATKFLISKGANVNQLAFMNEKGSLFTPLMNAACSGNVRLTGLLLNGGASLEKRNNDGNTALMEAAMRPHPELVKFLVEHGANINSKAPKGHTALIYAADYGQIENIKVLLAAGADPNAAARLSDDSDEEGNDAVQRANMRGRPEGAALILEAQKRTTSAMSRR